MKNKLFHVLTLFVFTVHLFLPTNRTAASATMTPSSPTSNSQTLTQTNPPISSLENSPANPLDSNPRPYVNRPEPRIGPRHDLDLLRNGNGAQIIRGSSALTGVEADLSTTQFIENAGQFDPQVLYYARIGNTTLQVGQKELWVTTIDEVVAEEDPAKAQADPYYEAPKVEKGNHFRITLPNAKANPKVEGMNPVQTTVSYLIGNDAEKWQISVPVYDGIRLQDVYPGVDFEIAGLDQPGDWRYVVKDKNSFSAFLNKADRGAIGLKVEGGSKIETLENALGVETTSGKVLLPKPVFRDEQNHSRKFHFKSVETIEGDTLSLIPDLSSAGEASISNTPLSLSATESGSTSSSSAISYSTYFGGSNGEQSLAIAVDPQGAIYVTGSTVSTDFPTTTGAYNRTLMGGCDTFISKINPTGTAIVYSTYIGGSSDDESRGIAVDASGAAYITGRTFSTNFPTTSGVVKPSKPTTDDDGYVVKLAPDGTHLDYSTYIGGTGGEQGFDIAINQVGEAYLTGQTFSTDFPTTPGAYQRMYGGGSWDGYVARLNTTGTAFIFSTYIAGNRNDCENGGIAKECSVRVDANGNVYVFGVTDSTLFPTTIEGDMSYNGSGDAFAWKLSPDGRSLLFGTYLGGSGRDCLYDCSGDVDSSGAIYISGSTSSVDFPQTLGTRLGGDDIFVTKLYTDGRGIAYSMVFGGSGADNGGPITVLPFGEVFITGSTTSSDFPVAPEAFQPTLYGPEDAFLMKLNPDATSYFSTYFGGTAQDFAKDIAVDISGGAYISGTTYSTDYLVTAGVIKPASTGNDMFLTKFSSNLQTSVKNQVTYNNLWTKDNRTDCRDCRRKMASKTQGYGGDPINTRTGGFDYSITDLSFPTSAGEMIFQRSYSSSATATYTLPLGPGWTHNHDTRLIFSTDPGGDPDGILFKSHSLNVYRYLRNPDGTYSPDNGVQGSLVYSSDSYQLTDADQNVYSFGEDGKLTLWRDSKGHSWTYTYGTGGNLSRVSDDTGLHYLDFHYTAGYLTSVSDFSGREVVFGQDAANDLTSVTDAADQGWTYVYDAEHRLQQVIDPNGHNVVDTEYDPEGRAYRQYDGKGQLVLEVVYNADGTTQLIDGEQNTQVHNYNSRNILYKAELSASTGSAEYQEYNENFQPSVIVDPNKNRTDALWSPDGVNLNVVVAPAGDRTDLFFDGLNNLTNVTDPNGYLTSFGYENDSTLLTTSTDALEHETHYTYTTAADAPQPLGLIKTVEDPLGRVTRYTYNSFGKVTTITDAANQVTTYDYDALGRQKTVQYPSGRKDWSCYDALERVVRQVRNASGAGASPQTDPCDAVNYQPSADTAYDRISQTVYDLGGNTIATIAPDGVITRTYYDENNRPVSVVRNLYGQDITTQTVPTFDSAFPDRNVRTDTVYNLNGAVIATIDPLGIITRTYYDSEKRPEYVVQNLSGQDITVDTLPTYNSNYPDRNLTTRTVYDPAGNIIATVDPAGMITRTYYDADNRPVTKVINLTNRSIEETTPPEFSAETPDANVRYDTVYDANGNAIAIIDPLGIITRTYYDALNQPVAKVQNLTGQAIDVETPPTYDPLHPAQNVRTDYAYDAAGNQIAVIDPNGVIHRTYYDVLNRAVFVVDNLVGQAIDLSTPPVYDPDFPDQNVRTEMVYNDFGDQIASIDPNGKITRYYYDPLSRVWLTVRNLTGQLIDNPIPPAFNPAFPDQNVRTETVYDAANATIASIAADGKIARTYYDKLGRAITRVENLTGISIPAPTPPGYDPNFPDQNVRTDQLYDGAGRVVRSEHSDAADIISCYDAMGRVVKQVQNPSVANPCPVYTPATQSDTDIITETQYDPSGNPVLVRDPLGKETLTQFDALRRVTRVTDPLQHYIQYGYDGNGNRTSITNANGVVTRFEYDALGRLAAVVENYLPGLSPTAEINVRTEYSYDANGNLRTIKDALSHVTTLTYDALGRQKTERDALDHGSTYAYDAGGNRTSVTDANDQTTIYQYDGLNRVQTVDYPEPDANVVFSYDPNGLTKTVTDGLGTTTWDYDDLGRVESVTDPFSKLIRYRYDGSGKRTKLIYPDTRSVDYGYDQVGRLNRVTDWSTRLTQYGYDKAGRAVSTTLPNGVSVIRGFDDAGRLQQITNQSGPNLISSFAYTYDPQGNRTKDIENITPLTADPSDLLFSNGFDSGSLTGWSASVTDQGNLSATTAAALTGSYGMQAVIDDNNNLYVEDDSPADETRYKAGFQIDPNTLSMASGDAFVVFEGEDSTGAAVLQVGLRYYRGAYQIQVLIKVDNNAWKSATWYAISDAAHQIDVEWKASTSTTAKNGRAELWIDGVSRQVLTSVDNDTHRLGLVKLGAVSGIDSGTRGSLYFDSFTSHRTQAWGTTPAPKTIQYVYDPLGRLAEAVYSDGVYFSYDYDAAGNQLSKGSLAGTISNVYDAANRLTSSNGVTYTWDNNGNLLADGTRSYTYNHANQLTNLVQGPSSYAFAYDGLGNRYQQTVNAATTTYTLDIAGDLSQVLADGTNTYVYGWDRIAQDRPAGTEYFLPDALGSVRHLMTASATVSLTRAYDPYGGVLSSTGSGTTSYGFAGEWTDQTGLQNLRARYYLPQAGRFINQDTWPGNYSTPQTLNKYVYGNNNPVNGVDPSGHFPLLLATALAGAVIGASVDILTQAIPQIIDENNSAPISIKWEEVAGAAAAGGVAGLTLGVGTMVAGATGATMAATTAIGAGSGAFGNVLGNQFGLLVESKLKTHTSILSESTIQSAKGKGFGNGIKMGVDFVAGAVAGGVGANIGYRIAQRGVPKMITSGMRLTNKGSEIGTTSMALRNELGRLSYRPNFNISTKVSATYREVTSLVSWAQTCFTTWAAKDE